MPMAKVWNKNYLPFTQDFEGTKIHIEPNHFIVMDFEKGRQFAGKYYPIEVDAGGQQKPESYKMIVVEPLGQNEMPAVEKMRCQACAFVANNKEELDNHITDNHVNLMLDKEEREKRKAKG